MHFQLPHFQRPLLFAYDFKVYVRPLFEHLRLIPMASAKTWPSQNPSPWTDYVNNWHSWVSPCDKHV